jgi:hypothetical protein
VPPCGGTRAQPAVKAGEVQIVTALEGFEGADVLLANRTRLQPDAVIAATRQRPGLEPLVGDLGVTGADGRCRACPEGTPLLAVALSAHGWVDCDRLAVGVLVAGVARGREHRLGPLIQHRLR